MTEARARVRALEDGFTERKLDGTNRPDIQRTLVGFANSVPEGRTAILYLGLSNDGTPHGVVNADKLQRTVRSIAEQDCYPAISITSEVVTVDGKHIVAVIVPYSPDRPHFAGKAFVRKGSETVEASRQQYEELIASRHSKAGAILALKGQVISVITVAKILGDIGPFRDPMRRERHECCVETCTTHFVTLYDITTSRTLTEPLGNVSVNFDAERNRPMVVVQPEQGR